MIRSASDYQKALVKVARFRGTRLSKLMLATRSKRWNAPHPRRASDTLTAWRTPRERKFRMSGGIHFRMLRAATPLKRS